LPGFDGTMDVYWLEQTASDVPAEDDWLSASEVVRLNGFRFTKRRADWRLGRWTAKRAVAVCLNLPVVRHALADIEVRPAASGAPEVFLANTPAHFSISLSHREGTAVCAVALCGAALGCDLEIIEQHSDAFVADYFTIAEQKLVTSAPASDRPRLVSLLWSAKESTLKALHAGLRLDTRSVIVSPIVDHDPFAADTWNPLHVSSANGQVFRGWWRRTDYLLRTVVAAPPPTPPIPLEIAA
jgi:4'-phosphopantetheinyl transferase